MNKLKGLAVLLLLFFTLFLGQGLGRFYLGKITREATAEVMGREITLVSRGAALPRWGKKKVLRLKEVEYYTLLVETVEEREIARQIGIAFAQKGLPVIVKGHGPFEILGGLVNREEGLDDLLKQSPEAKIKKACLNEVSFKFSETDYLAVEEIAPFLGQVSLCLEKGLFLYPGTKIEAEALLLLRPKFALLADSLAEVASAGQVISTKLAGESEPDLEQVVLFSQKWGESLRQVSEEWTTEALLKSQQQGLALLEAYHYLLEKTN